MTLPPVSIVIITFNRPQEIRTTIAALQHNLYYDGPLTWHIADDCSPGEYAQDVRDWMQFELQMNATIHRTPKNAGWGANANNALRGVREQIVLMIEDDYNLQRPINITPYVVLLLENAKIGLVRLDGIAGHNVTAHAGEFNLGKWLPDYRAGFAASIGRLFYWTLDVHSKETWIYSNRPHLKHQRFHEVYGPYPEGLKLGATEEGFSHIVKDVMFKKPDAPRIVVPMELCLPVFDHIGKSYQWSEFDKGASHATP